MRENLILVLPAVLIAYFQVRVIWRKLPRSQENNVKVYGEYTEKDWFLYNFLHFFAVSLFWVQLVFVVIPISRDQCVICFLLIIGYLLILLGFTISIWALRTLGLGWSGMMEYKIVREQKLCTTGPYRIIRHPIYLAVILEMIGYQLVVSSWLVFVVGIIAYLVFRNHIKNEDKLLEGEYKEVFVRYKRQVGSLFPNLRDKSGL
ncbi:hypothetical protein COT86_03515 [Candidatus Collierbacteria bacterium CG10_big_fil_rev_8_21_14_0_10_43_36]|uniref:Isoprenylcysteine carboxylmethyltransferase family protein n=1 Tax=Candidatus Collierbacteria bacterium CG10_big_fil_rev_8_21_14_0_10_43_36 TaxID=1974534 RepID=A0A2H0VK91_9BACT|nr:isoprenylcysteine carboxylmethyltransferase family protein [bacterium]PIR99527.1 MAG: hypothetical protein COT86_03515 [Candidatus Collierbacteria bacterium CG10_big_fil_rev_8_21_14_0_10_43_36]